MPSASTQRTWRGKRSPAAWALSAGMSVSSTNVVLPEPGNARHRDETTARNIDFERFDGMDGLVAMRMCPWSNISSSVTCGRKRLDSARKNGAMRLPCDCSTLYCTGSDHVAAACSSNGAHLDQIVGFRQYARIVVDNNHGVAVIHRDRASHPTRPSTLAGCRPIEGSSST